MKRLTTESILGGWTITVPRQEAVNRLAAYEDTGLDPEDIKDFLDEIESRFILWVNKKYEMSTGRFLDIMQAEKDGHLVVLPCKIGDTVYIIRGEVVIVATVEAIHQWISGKWKLSVHTDKRNTHWVGYEVCFDDFGKTVFLTREEAEAALKREEKNNETD